MDFAGEGLEEVGQEELDSGPTVSAAELPHEGGVRREILDQNGQTPERKLTAPVVREVDLVEALKIGLYQVGMLAE